MILYPDTELCFTRFISEQRAEIWPLVQVINTLYNCISVKFSCNPQCWTRKMDWDCFNVALLSPHMLPIQKLFGKVYQRLNIFQRNVAFFMEKCCSHNYSYSTYRLTKYVDTMYPIHAQLLIGCLGSENRVKYHFKCQHIDYGSMLECSKLLIYLSWANIASSRQHCYWINRKNATKSLRWKHGGM